MGNRKNPYAKARGVGASRKKREEIAKLTRKLVRDSAAKQVSLVEEPHQVVARYFDAEYMPRMRAVVEHRRAEWERQYADAMAALSALPSGPTRADLIADFFAKGGADELTWRRSFHGAEVHDELERLGIGGGSEIVDGVWRQLVRRGVVTKELRTGPAPPWTSMSPLVASYRVRYYKKTGIWMDALPDGNPITSWWDLAGSRPAVLDLDARAEADQ